MLGRVYICPLRSCRATDPWRSVGSLLRTTESDWALSLFHLDFI